MISGPSYAIKHNLPGGTVIVELTTHQLTVCKPGKIFRLPTASFFNRFVKSDPNSKSPGLGLAIVKAIIETNHWQVDYQFQEGIHQIQILFPTTESLQNSIVMGNS